LVPSPCPVIGSLSGWDGKHLKGRVNVSEAHYGTSIGELVRQHDQDLYRGNGKPGLTVRMEKSEDRHTATEGRVLTLENYNKDRENRLDKKLNILIGAILTFILAVAAQHFRIF
jgi:hypothetical protein